MQLDIGSIICNDTGDQWFVTLKVQGKETKFEIDSGADVSIISEIFFNTLKDKPCLFPMECPLNSPDGRLNAVGFFNTIVTYRNQDYKLYCRS